MAAYAALISLSNTIDRIVNHNRISIFLEEKQQLLLLLEHANSFAAFLEKFPDKFNSLEGRMRKLAHEAEDIIEYFMLDQVSSWANFQKEVIKILLKKKIKNIRSKEYEGGADSPAHATSSTAPPIRKDSMVGLEDYVIGLKASLCGEPSELQVIPICGMHGIGKTTLGRYLYHDPSIMENFEIRVWVEVSQCYNPQRILSSILESLEGNAKLVKGQSYDEKVSEVHKILMGRRYLIVMDEICDQEEWDDVRRVFPDNHNGSRVMLITMLSWVASELDPLTKIYEMRLLNADESWNLLKKIVFRDEDCPLELEDVGKDIARCCKGWPLALVMMAEVLSTTTRTYASWKAWAEEYRDESRCYQHELNLVKVMEESGLIAGEVREIKDSSSSNNDVQHGAGPSADSIMKNSITMEGKAFDSIAGTVISMKKNNIKRGGAASSALSSSSTAPSIHKDVMVGFEDYLIDLKDKLCGGPSKRLRVIPICGMGGIGKTTLARNLYDDPLITNHFDIRVWVTISQDFSAKSTLSSLLESLKKFNTIALKESDIDKVYKIMKWRRYLVVMDDIWSNKAWDVLSRAFPDDGNGSRIMLTTRLSDVASYPDPSSKIYEMPLLNKDESWNLLKQNVFGDEVCPYELQDIGKKIAISCKGLPLAIVVMAGLLSTTMRKFVSWKVIAENVKSAEHDQIEEILALSYVHLPQYLRPCFLYMASFPEDEEIDVLKLIRLWIAEGFVKSPSDSDSFEKLAEEFLEELVKRNLVLVAKRKWDGRIERCRLHDLVRDLCIRKSHENRPFTKFWIRPSLNLHGSTIRSIKCSRNHPPGTDFIIENVRLLRVLDAEFLHGYHLLTQVHLDELLHMRYLAIGYTREFSLFLSRFRNLQTLVILDPYHSLRLKWCMSQLRHVYCEGTIDFDNPKETDFPLESLQTLSCVSLSTCREMILKMIPNLKKLKINCSKGLPSDGVVCLDDLVHLHRLEDLEICAGNRVKYYKVTFPRMLKKLTLRWWKLPWYLNCLPNLQVLELIGCTCVGNTSTWETTEGTFPVLEVLKILDSRLENWVTESSHFPRLKLLLVHFCHDLSGIPNDIGEIPTLQLIEVKEVKGHGRKSLIESLELIREEQEEMGNDTLQVVHSTHRY